MIAPEYSTPIDRVYLDVLRSRRSLLPGGSNPHRVVTPESSTPIERIHLDPCRVVALRAHFEILAEFRY